METVTTRDIEYNHQPILGTTRCHHKRLVEKPRPECHLPQTPGYQELLESPAGHLHGGSEMGVCCSLPSPPLTSLPTMKVQLKKDRFSEPESLSNVSTQPPNTGVYLLGAVGIPEFDVSHIASFFSPYSHQEASRSCRKN